MDREHLNEKQKRHLRFAEGGIIFVVILALTMYVGVKFAGQGPDTASTPRGAAASEGAELVAPAAAGAGGMADGRAVAVDAVEAAGAPASAAAEADVLAAAEARDVSATSTRRGPVSYAEAEAAYLAGDWAEAADLFDAYTAERPDNAWGHYMLGLSLWKGGDLEGAEDALETALAHRPDHLKSRINLGRVLLDLERPSEALTVLEAALAGAPESADGHRVLGRALHALGRSEDAAAAYRTALLRDPGDAWSLNNLALLAIEQERFAEAVAPAARAVELREDVACFHNNLAVALERTGRPALAAAAYDAALRADAGHERAAVSLDRLVALGVDPADTELDVAALAGGFDPAAALAAAEALTDRIAAHDSEEAVAGAAAEDVGGSGSDAAAEPAAAGSAAATTGTVARAGSPTTETGPAAGGEVDPR
ncbi:MAG: tetratricopeptide repeat protein [Candidatus Krumholzibacteriia bacterium]